MRAGTARGIFNRSEPGLLYKTNLIIISALLFALIVAAAEGGYRWGSNARRRQAAGGATAPQKQHVDAIDTALFALLGLLLAFTFSMSVSRYEARKDAMIAEANAMSTAFLRAALIPEPERSEAAALFDRYVAARLELDRPGWDEPSEARHDDQISQLQEELWTKGVTAAEKQPTSITGLFVSGLTEMLDAQATRDEKRRHQVPDPVLFGIFAVCLAAVGVLGYSAGLGGGRSLAAVLIAALLLTLVVALIMELDRPYRGFIRVGNQPIRDVLELIRAGLPLP